MSSHSDSELKINSVFKVKKKVFKAKERVVINADVINALKNRLHPELQEQRLLSGVSLHNTDAVEKLLEAGVDPNSTDRQLRSALHIAASRGYADIVTLLLKHGANPNKRDVVQNTPLHLAACTSNLPVITLLLNGGADVRSLDVHGRNPLQIARSKLQMLRRSWKEGAIETIQLRAQLEEVVDAMISLWTRKELGKVDDLELVKVSIHSGPVEEVDEQMGKLLAELRQFTIE